MGDSWRTWANPGDADPNDYTWGTDDTAPGCGYPEPHEHGFAQSGWKVVEHSMGGKTAMCRECVALAGDDADNPKAGGS